MVELNDLILVVNLIDTVVQRGAVKGPEMIHVGTLREKIANYVNQQIQLNQQNDDLSSEQK